MKKVPTRLFFEFGEFRLDAEKHRLLRDGEIVALTPKAVETLTVLIQRRGVLVERDELMNSVWRDVEVEDGNLTVTVSMLRKALGEDGNGRKFIETVPRLGYKFVADVREVVEEVPALMVEKRTLARVVIDEEIRLGRKGAAESSLRLFPATRPKLIAITAAAGIVVLVAALAYFQPWTRRANAGSGNIRSIAVLPFKSLSDDPDDKALSRGFADALVTSLGRVNEVRVISTNAVSRFADLRKEPSEVGMDLGVDAVLDGTLQRANGKLRVTLRLIRSADGAQIWSSTFDEAETEIFKLQDALASQTAQTLKWNLTTDQRRIGKRYTENRDAYQSYLRGRFFFDKRSSEDYEKAIVEFEQAIALDPNYALAITGLADVYALQANLERGGKRDALYEKSRAMAAKALELDEGLAEAHTSLGWVRRVHDWDWAGSEREFKRALELNSNDVNAHQWYALLLTTLGRTDEALAEIEKAKEIEPLSQIVLQNYFAVRQYRRENEQLPALAEQIASLEGPEWVGARVRSMAYSRTGNHAKVIEIGDAYRARNEGKITSAFFAGHLAIAYMRSGQAPKAKEMVDYLEQRARSDSEAAYRLATVYAELGRNEEAFALLEKCFAAHDDRMVWTKVDPQLNSLHADKRFQDLLRKMNL